jgi:hypothetical protein
MFLQLDNLVYGFIKFEKACGKTHTTSKLPTRFDDRVNRGGRNNPALTDDVIRGKGITSSRTTRNLRIAAQVTWIFTYDLDLSHNAISIRQQTNDATTISTHPSLDSVRKPITQNDGHLLLEACRLQ